MVYLLPMKRSMEGDLQSMKTFADCLTLFPTKADHFFRQINDYPVRDFECKTCGRRFPSFQALGGHRASHKKPRLMDGDDPNQKVQSKETPKAHECSICGMEFAMGQALGGHMRRHRGAEKGNQASLLFLSPPVAPVVKRSNSRRVFCIDLNLTPIENDLEFRFGKVEQAVGS